MPGFPRGQNRTQQPEHAAAARQASDGWEHGTPGVESWRERERERERREGREGAERERETEAGKRDKERQGEADNERERKREREMPRGGCQLDV